VLRIILLIINKTCFVCIFRQHLEREALRQKHKDEIEAFHHQNIMQQFNMNTSKFETHQQTSASSSTVSSPAVTAMYPVMYQSMPAAYTGNSVLLISLKQCKYTF
jgi:hypothetical protein